MKKVSKFNQFQDNCSWSYEGSFCQTYVVEALLCYLQLSLSDCQNILSPSYESITFGTHSSHIDQITNLIFLIRKVQHRTRKLLILHRKPQCIFQLHLMRTFRAKDSKIGIWFAQWSYKFSIDLQVQTHFELSNFRKDLESALWHL